MKREKTAGDGKENRGEKKVPGGGRKARKRCTRKPRGIRTGREARHAPRRKGCKMRLEKAGEKV